MRQQARHSHFSFWQQNCATCPATTLVCLLFVCFIDIWNTFCVTYAAAIAVIMVRRFNYLYTALMTTDTSVCDVLTTTGSTAGVRPPPVRHTRASRASAYFLYGGCKPGVAIPTFVWTYSTPFSVHLHPAVGMDCLRHVVYCLGWLAADAKRFRQTM